MHNINEYFYYLYNLERSGTKYDLVKIKKILNHLGNPNDKLKLIHIAGTNGKGATASFLASILMEHGFKTGLFISPHIIRFNERIRMNGKMIPDNYVKRFVDENLKYFKEIKPSFFEVNTAMALKYFYDKKADAAVVEVGLGGRLDSTNIIKPVLSIITQIGMDHTDMLGNTLSKIAKEKIGIVKPGIDIIVSDNHNELKPLFKKNIKDNHFYYLDDILKTKIINTSFEGSIFEIQSRKIHDLNKITIFTPLPGKYQIRNTETAILASLQYMKNENKNFSLFKAIKGIASVKANSGYHGRFELIRKDDRQYIFDVAHNPDGINESLENLNGKKVNVIVFGIMSDKDYKKSIRNVCSHADKIIFTKPANKRAQSPSVLYHYARKFNGINKLYWRESVGEAVETAKNIAGENGIILFIGSFFLVSDAVKTLRLDKFFS